MAALPDGVDAVVNVKLLSHPVNWLIVWVVLLFGGIAYTMVHRKANPMPVSTPQ
jgi:hypothetical protein